MLYRKMLYDGHFFKLCLFTIMLQDNANSCGSLWWWGLCERGGCTSTNGSKCWEEWASCNFKFELPTIFSGGNLSRALGIYFYMNFLFHIRIFFLSHPRRRHLTLTYLFGIGLLTFFSFSTHHFLRLTVVSYSLFRRGILYTWGWYFYDAIYLVGVAIERFVVFQMTIIGLSFFLTIHLDEKYHINSAIWRGLYQCISDK